MIDSIYVRLDRAYVSNEKVNYLRSILSNVQPYSNVKFFNGIEYANECIIGNYMNFKIRVYKDKITLHGSLPKFINGNNVEGIDFEQVGNAIRKLQSETGLPLFKGELSRVDIAECFSVSHYTGKYFNHLLDTPTYDRSFDYKKSSNGARYKKDNLVLAFYDKTDDARKCYRLTSASEAEHLLRIELRIEKNVRRTVLNIRTKFGVVYLLSHSFLKKIASLWVKHYESIVKSRIVIAQGKILGGKAFDKKLMLYALRQVGLIQWLSVIDTTAIDNKWTTVQKSKYKARLKKLYNDELTSKQTNYMLELDNKVRIGRIYTSQYIK